LSAVRGGSGARLRAPGANGPGAGATRDSVEGPDLAALGEASDHVTYHYVILL
jgi:hypothetical protein